MSQEQWQHTNINKNELRNQHSLFGALGLSPLRARGMSEKKKKLSMTYSYKWKTWHDTLAPVFQRSFVLDVVCVECDFQATLPDPDRATRNQLSVSKCHLSLKDDSLKHNKEELKTFLHMATLKTDKNVV